MADTRPITILCMSSYFKGEAFLEECKRRGCRIMLLTEQKLADEAWPRGSLDNVFLMPDLTKLQDVVHAVSYLFRSETIDQIIPLDEFDVETVAALREHLRLPGMGQTKTRYFRDKLAMRMGARDNGVPVPEFVQILNHGKIQEFMNRVPPPWVLKPRSEAATMGIKKVHSQEELWGLLNSLGDRQSYYLLEKFIPGDVYHVDSIIPESEIVFASAQKYGRPPMSITNEGGIFTTRTLPRDSADAQTLYTLNHQVVQALGMERGVTHAEYIQGPDGQFYFLEIAARVGGAHIADLVEAATGVNLWREWANVVIAEISGKPYQLPPTRALYGGLLVSLARQEYPDMSAYNDPEIVWRINKKHHAGVIVTSPDAKRIDTLLDSYVQRFTTDFMAYAPPKESHAQDH